MIPVVNPVSPPEKLSVLVARTTMLPTAVAGSATFPAVITALEAIVPAVVGSRATTNTPAPAPTASVSAEAEDTSIALVAATTAVPAVVICVRSPFARLVSPTLAVVALPSPMVTIAPATPTAATSVSSAE